MKAFKGLVLFCFLASGMSSCFDPPEFELGPKIEFKDIEFKKGAPNTTDADTLIVYLDFRDGDGDIGFDSQSDFFLNEPYHRINFYFADLSQTKVIPVGTIVNKVTFPPAKAGDPPITINVPTITKPFPEGKLVSKRTRENNPEFSFLPIFRNTDLNCKNFTYTTDLLLVSELAKNCIDTSFNITDTITINGLKHYLLKDTLYFSRNPHHYNARVRFYQSSGSGFSEFIWEDNYCGGTLNGRLPILSDQEGAREGTIKWAMRSAGIETTFSIKTLKLDIIIEDRALNKDSVRTREFTLSDIRVN